MKKVLFLLLILSAGSITGFAQCDKKAVLNGSKTEYLGADSSVQRSVDEKSVIEFDKTNMIITAGDGEHKMSGPVKSITCDWKVPFKEGKSVIKVALGGENGEAKDVTITITGKEGKITFLAEVDNDPNKKIRVTIDSFAEKL